MFILGVHSHLSSNKADLKSPTTIKSEQLSQWVDVTSPTVDLIKLDVVSPVKLNETSPQFPKKKTNAALSGIAPGIEKLKQKLGPQVPVKSSNVKSPAKSVDTVKAMASETAVKSVSPGGSQLKMKLKLPQGASPSIISANTPRSGDIDVVNTSPLKKVDKLVNASETNSLSTPPKDSLKLVITKDRLSTSADHPRKHHKHKHKHHKKHRSHHHGDREHREDREHKHSRKRAHSPGQSSTHGDQPSSAKQSRSESSFSNERLDLIKHSIGQLIKANSQANSQGDQSELNARAQKILSSNVDSTPTFFDGDSPSHNM